MSERIFLKNIERRITDIAVQTRHASQKGISNQAKSGYYRFAILLSCTIVEGLLYHIVEKYLHKNGGFMGSSIAYKQPHNIPAKYSKGKTVLCFQEKVDIPLSNQTKFSKLIEYSDENKIIDKEEKKELKKIMRLRNKIHVQSLNENDDGYTRKKLDNTFDIINYLVKKIIVK